MINGFEDEQIEVDFCNEYLAINILERKSILTFSNFGKAVIRIQLNRTNLKYCDHEFFDDRVELVEKWSSYLPGFTSFVGIYSIKEFFSIWLTWKS